MAYTFTRQRIIQAIGATALLSTITATVFFVLYALTMTSQQPILSAISIFSAALNICACVPIIIFTISSSNHKRSHRLCGAVPSIVAGLVSACALGWLGVRRDDLPPNILGQNPAHIVLAGYGVEIATIVLQSVFFTAINLSFPSHTTTDHESNLKARFPCQCTELVYPSPTASASKLSLSSTIRDPKHPFVTQVYHSTSPKTLRDSPTSTVFSPLHTIQDKGQHPTAGSRWTLGVEVNHFDDWETSDVSVTERVVASLAVAEREAMEEEQATRGFAKSRRTECLAVHDTIQPTSSVCESEVSAPDRRNSPPLPDSDVSPRNCAFMLPVNAVLASSVPRFAMRGGGMLGGASMSGGTGKWLARSRAVD